jgi:hypothetical protein
MIKNVSQNMTQLFQRFMEFVSCVKDAEKLKGKVRGSGGMPVLLAIGVSPK